MSLIFVDSFDLYSSSQVVGRYDAGSGGTIASGAARFPPGNGMAMQNVSLLMRQRFPANATMAMGCSLKKPNTGTQSFFLIVYDGTTAQATAEWNTNSNTVTARRGGEGGTVLGTVPFIFHIPVWYFVEAEFIINDTTGRIRIWIDNALVLDVNGVDTQATANSFVDGFRVFADNTPWHIDDLYVTNGAGSVNTGRLGPRRIVSPVQNGDGTTNQWTRSTGSTNYTLVDERPPAESDFVETSTPNNIDLYNFAALGLTADGINGVQSSFWAAESGVTERQIRAVHRVGVTNYFGPTLNLLGSSRYHQSVQEQNPNTAADWTVSDIDNAEFGVQLVS